MTLTSCTPSFSRLLPPPSPLPKLHETCAIQFGNTSFLPLFSGSFSVPLNITKFLKPKASVSESDHEISENNVLEHLDPQLLASVAAAKGANEALQMIAEMSRRDGGVVCITDCCSIISAALSQNNVELAMSVFFAMRASFDQVGENGLKRWKWSRPNAHVYTLLIQGLASSLRVSDALRVIEYICEVAVSPGEEVPFGKIVRCPSCRIAVAVAQPQQGIQIVSCANCRYQYELVSGDIISIQSEEISMDISPWERGLRFLQLKKKSIPAAVHSIVVQTPSGMARTHRFATETVDLPAQEGERVTVAVAAPSNVYREVGPFKFSPRAPDFYPGEAMCLTNHKDGRESLLLRAPSKEGSSSLLKPSFLFPILAVFATGDAASGLIDPSLPQVLSIVAVSSLAVGATLNSFVFPQLNQLPQGSVEATAIKQRLLSQYDVLQSRIKDLKEASEKEVWMLARMCQLENKISAVGEPSYRARRSRIKRVQESLLNSLRGRIELIDSYARISSMIEIEVEMDTDVPAAETASNADSIMDQIQQTMELENLEERWKIQAEANDEAERLLSSQPLPSEEI
ncbi:PPR superfamily protein [Senna tora]|uniref:PPR superfamily protein n=1 Tax=Senna tora TaxID=362788 RepID=A0A834TT96_9FABA|nr:PPR superfamily protein [Senna tora]